MGNINANLSTLVFLIYLLWLIIYCYCCVGVCLYFVPYALKWLTIIVSILWINTKNSCLNTQWRKVTDGNLLQQ